MISFDRDYKEIIRRIYQADQFLINLNITTMPSEIVNSLEN